MAGSRVEMAMEERTEGSSSLLPHLCHFETLRLSVPQCRNKCMRPRHYDALPQLVLQGDGSDVLVRLQELTCGESEDRKSSALKL